MNAIELFWNIHQPNRRDWACLKSYLHQAPEKEAWLFMRLLSGHYWYPRTPSTTLIKVAAQSAHLPEALLVQSARETSDTAEAITLILVPAERAGTHFSEDLTLWFLHQLPALLRSEEHLMASLPALWQTISQKEAFFLHKVLLHSAHLPALRQPGFLLSFLQQRWPLPESLLLSHFRTYLEPPSNALTPTLF